MNVCRAEQNWSTERLRVLQIITRLAARGAPRHVIDLVENLDRERFDVDILTGTAEPDEGSLLAEAERRGLRVTVVPEMVRSVRPVKDAQALHKIYRYVRRGGYDIVHTHISKAGILGRVAARMAGVPVVVHTYHGPVEELRASRWLRQVERSAARVTDALIAVSDTAMEYQLALGIGTREQYRVIRNGIDLEHFTPCANGGVRAEIGGGPVIGTVGSLTAEKGTGDLIAAVAGLLPRYPALRLCVVGDGNRRQALEAQVKSHGLAEHVVFAGNVSDVRRWLAAFDVFVLPSRSEGMSRALIEAMASGCPVVATRVGDASTVVGEAGQLVTPGDVDGLGDAIAALLADEPRRKLEKERSQRVAGRFDVRVMAEEVGTTYEHLLQRRDRSECQSERAGDAKAEPPGPAVTRHRNEPRE